MSSSTTASSMNTKPTPPDDDAASRDLGPTPANPAPAEPTPADPTQGLLHSWHSGDRSALQQLVAHHLDWVRDHVHRRLRPELRDAGDTQDFVQEAMVAVLEYGPQFRVQDGARFRALVARIVENDIRDRHRFLHRARRDVARRAGPATDTVLELDPAVRSVTSPSVAADREERQEWLRLALELLDPSDREIIRMRDWEERTFVEAGELLGIQEDAARKRYTRALPKLAQKVAKLRAGQLDAVLGEVNRNRAAADRDPEA